MQSSSSPSPDRPLERELLRRFLQASRRSQILALVGAARAEDELAELVVNELCEAFEAEIAIVLAAVPSAVGAQVLGSAGLAVEERELLRVAASGAALPARVAHVQRGVDLLGLGARSLVSAPFTAREGERGAIVLACLDDRHFDDADLALVESVAECLGSALARLRHAAALAERAERLHALFERAPVAMLVADDTLEIVEANAAACSLLARDPEALATLARPDLVARGSADAEVAWQLVLDPSATAGVVLDLVRPDGSLVEAELTATADVFPGGHVVVFRERGTTMAIVPSGSLAAASVPTPL